jgi:hypothetical protein
LIQEPVADALDIDSQATQEIIRLTNAHPYFIQLICWALVNHCNEYERNTAGIADVNTVIQEILVAGGAPFAYIWTQTQGVVERLVLVELAHILDNKKSAQPDDIMEKLSEHHHFSYKRAEIVHALDQLVKREVLELNKEDALSYRFQIELLRLWVKETQSIAAILEREA